MSSMGLLRRRMNKNAAGIGSASIKIAMSLSNKTPSGNFCRADHVFDTVKDLFR